MDITSNGEEVEGIEDVFSALLKVRKLNLSYSDEEFPGTRNIHFKMVVSIG